MVSGLSDGVYRTEFLQRMFSSVIRHLLTRMVLTAKRATKKNWCRPQKERLVLINQFKTRDFIVSWLIYFPFAINVA